MPLITGFLFPESVLDSAWFSIFATFVAINTVVYVSLGISKLFPVIRFSFRRGGQNRRGQERSIYVGAGNLKSSDSANAQL